MESTLEDKSGEGSGDAPPVSDSSPISDGVPLAPSGPRLVSSAPGHHHSERSLEDMERMRKEIRQLQEKRAAAMMNEVVEMQRERDMAVGRVKILTQTLEDVTMENAVLKESVGRGDQVRRLFHLEKSLVEEQLYSSDIKKKLQNANNQIASHKSKIKLLELRQNSTNMNPSTSFLSVGEDSALERSRSMNDMEQELDRNENEPSQEKQNEGDSHYLLTRISTPKQQRETSKGANLLNTPKTGSSSQFFSPSPTVIPRRYKLATIQQKAVGTQVNLTSSPEKSRKSESEEVTLQQETLEKLQLENKELESRLSELTSQRESTAEELKRQKKTYKNLQAESNTLRDGLSEFTLWVRQKIQLVEEDIDVCRVIYSLHGSLSQEAALLRDMQDRLGNSEQKIANLESTNKNLAEKVKLIEDKYKRAKQQNGLLKEKIVLLTPNKSSKQSFYTPPITSSPKPHRTLNLSSHSPHFTSSPLLRHTTPTSREAQEVKIYLADNDVV